MSECVASESVILEENIFDFCLIERFVTARRGKML